MPGFLRHWRILDFGRRPRLIIHLALGVFAWPMTVSPEARPGVLPAPAQARMSNAGPVEGETQGPGRRYARVSFARVPDAALRAHMERTCSLRFLGVHEARPERVVYPAALESGLEAARQALGAFPGFLRLEAIAPAEKLDTRLRLAGNSAGAKARGTAGVHAGLEFHADVDARIADRMARRHADSILHSGPPVWLVRARPVALHSLAHAEEVASIWEFDPHPVPVSDLSRRLTRVDEVQGMDTSVFPPDSSWLAALAWTGDSVVVAVYDNGVDSNVFDFREMRAGRPMLRRPHWDKRYWQEPDTRNRVSGNHGTMVAGAALGNGWRSVRNGGRRYQWRGVAPKALLLSRGALAYGMEGDVNNYSFVTTHNGHYSPMDKQIDANLFNHAALPHVNVYGAGNAGGDDPHGSAGQKGYYSITAASKNGIAVGAVGRYDGRLWRGHAQGSSLGPTRDGRLKPDLVAPGAAHHDYPWRTRENPLRFQIDLLRIVGPDGFEKVGYDFDDGNQGWGEFASWRLETLPNDGRTLTVHSHYWHSYLHSGPIEPGKLVASAGDTLHLRYRYDSPRDSAVFREHLSLAFWWRRLKGNRVLSDGAAGAVDGNVDITLPRNGGAWSEFRAALRDLDARKAKRYWEGGDTLVRLRLDINADSARAVHVPDWTFGSGGEYVTGRGTSMAAPHVTGIAALMLQKYHETVLMPSGRHMRTHPFWNSTAKAILVHTATDLAKPLALRGEPPNPDTRAGTIYHRGPDWATGFGLVNAQKALEYVDVSRLREDSLDHSRVSEYFARLPNGLSRFRVTLAWDDAAGNAHLPPTESRLVNDLDLVLVAPSGKRHLPWILDPPPQGVFRDSAGRECLPLDGIDPIGPEDIRPARPGVNRRDNVEMVDVEAPGDVEPGRWRILVAGRRVPWGPQHFSLVADFPILRAVGAPAPRLLVDGSAGGPDRASGDFETVGGGIRAASRTAPHQGHWSQ